MVVTTVVSQSFSDTPGVVRVPATASTSEAWGCLIVVVHGCYLGDRAILIGEGDSEDHLAGVLVVSVVL